MIKLIATDMDGTLLNDRKEVSEENKLALQKAIDAGVKVVLSTGRPLFGVIPIFLNLGLKNQDDFVIVNNGCSVHSTKDWKLLDYVKLNESDITRLYNLVKDTDVQLVLTNETTYYVVEEAPSETVIYDASLTFQKPVVISLEEACKEEYNMFQAMVMGKPDAIDQFENANRENLAKDYSVVRSQTYIFEVLPQGTSKASALEKLATDLGIKADEILALGDGNNDIEMLEFAGYSVAMDNAGEAVKAVAKYKTESNNEHGVAKAIERFIFKK
ncbi:MAG: Cof-type HAD-IIB family hydrolase [Gemella sp.]|nr:Cof-type HAD-IIB family hydrolase [Gemella sp.]